MASEENLSCAFCRRIKDEVKHLLAGPGIAVCGDCVGDLSAILAEESSDWRDAQIERLSKLPEKSHSPDLLRKSTSPRKRER